MATDNAVIVIAQAEAGARRRRGRRGDAAAEHTTETLGRGEPRACRVRHAAARPHDLPQPDLLAGGGAGRALPDPDQGRAAADRHGDGRAQRRDLERHRGGGAPEAARRRGRGRLQRRARPGPRRGAPHRRRDQGGRSTRSSPRCSPRPTPRSRSRRRSRRRGSPRSATARPGASRRSRGRPRRRSSRRCCPRPPTPRRSTPRSPTG